MGDRQYRASWDELNFLDADCIAAWGALDGYVGAIQFETSAPSKVHVEHDTAADTMTVMYHWADRRASPVRSSVSIERRPCPFGGTRAFFRCPRCSRSTLRLAVLRAGLLCGRCGRITWGSRREGRTQRLARKAWRLARRLGMEHYLDQPARPRHMHNKTYRRLCEQLLAINAEIERDISVRLGRMSGTLARLRYLGRLGL